MIGSNPVPAVCDYGSAAQYRDLPNEEQIRTGVVPLDSLPAAWWNCMWYDTNKAVNCARYALGVMINEINTVLQQAGVCVNPTCVDQLYQAIDNVKTTIGNATVAGSVKSSSTPGMVSIDANGFMTANCVGNANNLTTTAHTVVGAINELKTKYDGCVSDLTSCLSSLNNSKAPVAHASAQTTYGVGSSTNFGHLKISDTYTSLVGDAAAGVAASQKAAYCVYTLAASTSVMLSDATPAALGGAWAGVSSCASRADHIHPLPNWIECAGAVRAGYVSTTFAANVPYFSNVYTICNNTPYYAYIFSSWSSNTCFQSIAPWGNLQTGVSCYYNALYILGY